MGLPGQAEGDRWRGTGYERGGWGLNGARTHAMRTSVRPEGQRRSTLCGVLAEPITGQYFMTHATNACRTCVTLAAAHPLPFGISVSNELSRLRAVIDEAGESRLAPSAALAWLRAQVPAA